MTRDEAVAHAWRLSVAGRLLALWNSRWHAQHRAMVAQRFRSNAR